MTATCNVCGERPRARQILSCWTCYRSRPDVKVKRAAYQAEYLARPEVQAHRALVLAGLAGVEIAEGSTRPCERCGTETLNPRFCSKTCRRPLVDRFWPRVDRSGGLFACWPWMGHRNPGGYGWLRGEEGTELANRVAYRLTNGAIPDGLLICHTCDNPPCCNPAHLYAGTPADNVADMMARGRNRSRSMAVAS